MSSDCIFDPRLNIVAVDPDSKSVIQIPGTEFQAQVTPDSYERIALYPNYYTGFNYDGWGAPDVDPRDGEYVLGVAVENRNRYGLPLQQAARSLMFRIVDPHIITAQSDDLYAYVVKREYDKYMEYTDFNTYNKRLEDFKERGFVRFKWQEMKNDGVSLPAANVSLLSFKVEIYRGSNQAPVSMSQAWSGPLPYHDGPFSSPIVVPVRVHIAELWAA